METIELTEGVDNNFFDLPNNLEVVEMTSTRNTTSEGTRTTRRTTRVEVPDEAPVPVVAREPEPTPLAFVGEETVVIDSPSDLWHLGTIHIHVAPETVEDIPSFVNAVQTLWDALRSQHGSKPMNVAGRGTRVAPTAKQAKYAEDIAEALNLDFDVDSATAQETQDFIEEHKNEMPRRNSRSNSRSGRSSNHRSNGRITIKNPNDPVSDSQVRLLSDIADRLAGTDDEDVFWEEANVNDLHDLTKGAASDLIGRWNN